MLTPVPGGTDVIVSEVEDLEGGQAVKPVGVYNPDAESGPVFFGGPMRYALRPIPEEVRSAVSVLALHSPGKRMTLRRETSPQSEA